MEALSPMNREHCSKWTLGEIARVRDLASKRALVPFARNLTTWELLLLIKAYPDTKISSIIEMSTTRQLSRSSTVRFIQEQISSGALEVRVGDKRSAKLLRLSKKVDGQLEDFLIQYAEAHVYKDIQSWHDGLLQNDNLRE